MHDPASLDGPLSRIGFGTSGVRGLVVDLRNNPGGLLDQSIKISDIFLSGGRIVSSHIACSSIKSSTLPRYSSHMLSSAAYS